MWNFFTEKTSLWERVGENAPFLFGFVLPLGLLLLVYTELGDANETPSSQADATKLPEAPTGPATSATDSFDEFLKEAPKDLWDMFFDDIKGIPGD